MHAKILQIQFALFYRQLIERPDISFKKFIDDNSKTFDAIPITQNVPMGLPGDIPIVSLNSEDNKNNCNISRERIDFICRRTDDYESNGELLNRFNRNVENYIQASLNITKVKRFGIIATYFFDCEDPVETIRKKYTPNLNKEICELSINFNKRHGFKNFWINDIINISLGEKVQNSVVEKGIIIQRDINNTPQINSDNIDLASLKSISKKYSSFISEESILELIN